MSAAERAWNELGWDVYPERVNAAGNIIQAEIRRWNLKGRTDEDYCDALDICDDLDLQEWDARVGVAVQRTPERSPLLDEHADEDRDNDEHTDCGGYALQYANSDAYRDEHRNALARLAHAIKHGDS